MGLKTITDDAWLLSLGAANAVLLRHGGELTLVDAGFPGKTKAILKAIRKLGHEPAELKHIVFTHAHPDHIGSAAEMLAQVSAETWMHSQDVSIAESGGPFRPMSPARELLQRILYRLVWRPGSRVGPVPIDHRVEDGDELPVAGGLRVVHTPGHSAGQISLLWQGTRLLIVGDVATNFLRLGDPIGFEDAAEGRRSQQRLAGLAFDAAAFGHGSAIRHGADRRFRKRWSRG